MERSGESLLVWTTTPWTLPSNLAIAVGADIDYVLIDGYWIADEEDFMWRIWHLFEQLEWGCTSRAA